MSESQLREIHTHLRASLEVFRKHDGALNVAEVSLKSMLSTAQAQVDALVTVKHSGASTPDTINPFNLRIISDGLAQG